MITIDGIILYDATEVAEQLELKYSSTITLLRKNNMTKIKRQYYLTKEEIEQLRNRKNQNIKAFMLKEII